MNLQPGNVEFKGAQGSFPDHASQRAESLNEGSASVQGSVVPVSGRPVEESKFFTTRSTMQEEITSIRSEKLALKDSTRHKVQHP
jgi:hypothetical protein